jgi:ABC-type phosphate transport system substrate-binding protein
MVSVVTTTRNSRGAFTAGAIGLLLSLAGGAAMADVVAVVSSKSPLATLSKNQVTEIFLGKTTRFPDGTQAMPIDQQEGSATRDEFYALFAGRSAAEIKSHWTKIIFTGRGKPPRTVADSVEARKLTAANPQAISYMERRDVDSTVKVILQP